MYTLGCEWPQTLLGLLEREPGHGYDLKLAAPYLDRQVLVRLTGTGLAAALAVITVTLPLLRRITTQGSAHFE
jgi:hypothetical protein